MNILFGFFITHIPVDGEAINQFGKIWNKPVFSLFHDIKMLNLFLSLPDSYHGKNKPLIEDSLGELGLNSLNYIKRVSMLMPN